MNQRLVNYITSIIYSIKALGPVSINGQGHQIVIPFGYLRRRGKIKITGEMNIISLSKKSKVHQSKILISGTGCMLEIGENCLLKHTKINIASGANNKLTIGNNSTFEGGTLNVADGTWLSIGDNCMFSWQVDVFSSDMHSIICNEKKARINPGKNTQIGSHVWVSTKSTILKGVVINEHSVVAAGSVVVAGEYPAHSLLSGLPAKIKRSNIEWLKQRI